MYIIGTLGLVPGLAVCHHVNRVNVTMCLLYCDRMLCYIVMSVMQYRMLYYGVL